MPHRRPPSRAVFPALLLATAAVAACADTPLAPAAHRTAPSAAIAADAFGLDPVFATPDPGTVEGFDFLGANATPAQLAVPMAPISWDTTRWSLVRHQRDPESWYRIEPMMAWHGTMCQKPDDPVAVNRTHQVTEYRDMVFLCRNHMMTATNSRGYGVNYLTPPRIVDFSSGTAVVRFDVATLRESGRDWIDLWLTPYAENLVAPLDDSLPDLQGQPRRSLHVRMTAQRGRSAFVASVVRDFVGAPLPIADTTSYETAFAARGLAPSATRRDTFELHVSRTHVRFGMPRYNLWWVDADVPGGLDWSQAVMQIGHHSFNPSADGGGPTTWHWDNVGAAPSVPFTIVRANRRYVDDATPSGEITFATPAPPNAFLRGEGIGATEVSFSKADGKFSKWDDVTPQAQRRIDPTRFASGWMPLPIGTTRVRFRPIRPLLPASGGRWFVRDVEYWATPPGFGAAAAALAAHGRENAPGQQDP